jgi:proline iminopeptidase
MMMLPPFLPLESRRYQLPDFAYVVAPILEKESSVFGGQSPPIKCLSLDLLGESCFHRAMLPSSPTRLPARESAFSRNGASLWLREAGVAAGAPTVFLHGGPGYNSYVFERVAGPHLEKVLRMVYFDQRACGRSSGDAGADPIAESVADLDALRIYLGAERLQLIGHS